MNQLSVSLDFQDARHDEFRRRPGLFAHLEETPPRLAALRYGDIMIYAAITSSKPGELGALSDLAECRGHYFIWCVHCAENRGSGLLHFRLRGAGFAAGDGEETHPTQRA